MYYFMMIIFLVLLVIVIVIVAVLVYFVPLCALGNEMWCDVLANVFYAFTSKVIW
jgi:hypothetical protein